eukprot:s558_g38.t1
MNVPEVFLRNWPEKPWRLKGNHFYSQHFFADSSLEPLSSPWAVLIRKKSAPLNQFHRSDDFYNVPSSWFSQEPAGPADDPEHDNENDLFLHDAPDSVQLLFDAFMRAGVTTGPRIEESVYVRSWFVNHLHEHQCWHPRILEINGHWSTWFHDILSGWRDRYLPQEGTIFNVVYPDPPRVFRHRNCILDLVIAQGIEAPRKAGLITVLHGHGHQEVRFAVAASLPDVTSGHQLAQSAEILHECNIHTCVTTHDGLVIPFTMAPTHEMQDGDSLLINVHLEPAASQSVDVDESMQCSDSTDQTDDSSHSERRSPFPMHMAVDMLEEQLQGVHVFRLGYLPAFGRVRWNTVDHILVDAARVVRVPALTAPRVLRQVYKVVPTLLRQHLLQMTGVAAYCEWIRPDCLVSCNRVPWSKNDIGPRTISHGMYFRIVIPPPPDPTWEIGHVLKVFQECAELFDPPEAGRLAEEILHHSSRAAAPAPAPARCDNFIPQGRQLKGADLGPYDIDVPTMHAPAAYRQPLHPRHDGSLQWLIDLGQIFVDNAEDEAFFNEPLLYVQTWFIHHERHRSCRVPRPIRLESQSVTWIDDFRHLWNDLMTRDEVFSIHVVKPRPPQVRHSSYACHVIVEQAPARGLVASVITALFEGDRTARRDGFMQGAFSVPKFIRSPDVIDAMEIAPFCTGRRCTIHAGQQPVHLVEATELVNGCSLKVYTAPPNAQLPIAPHEEGEPFADVMFLQTDVLIRDLIHLMQPIVSPHLRGFDVPANVGATRECSAFQFNAHAAEFQPTVPFLHEQPDHINDLFAIWSTQVAVWEEDSMPFRLLSWFVDHRHHIPHCFRGRTVDLTDHYTTWEDSIKAVWADWIDPSTTVQIHVVEPHPPGLETGVAAHLILIQAAQEDLVTSLVSVDDPGLYGPAPRRVAVTTHEHIQIEHILLACQLDLSCLFPNQLTACEAWHRDQQLRPGQPIPGRSGYSIVLHIARRTPVQTVIPLPDQDDVGFLQLPPGSVNSRVTLSLDAVLPVSLLVPINLVDGASPPVLMDHVLLEDPVTENAVESELASMGYHRHAYLLGGTGFAFCLPIDWTIADDKYAYVFYPLQGCERASIILHQGCQASGDLDLMKLLHSFGFFRAVIVSKLQVRTGLTLVQYHNNEPTLEQTASQLRTPSPWPKPMPICPVQPFFDPSLVDTDSPTRVLTSVIDFSLLVSFFESGKPVLCPWHSHLELPDVVRTCLPVPDLCEGQTHDLGSFDRLVIYTDGSSKSHNRRKPPLWVQEHDVPDSWAFVVLGERYATSTTASELVFLGWHAQCVTYEEDLAHFVGTDAIGSEFAEREAIFWAALWRLSVNLTIPTIFRSDSVTSTEQSLGQAGSHDAHPTFCSLRCVMQALAAALPPDCFAVEHVRGHAGDVWNEMADFLAKSEAAVGHKLTHQRVNLRQFGPFLPYLWMLFDTSAGLPRFTTAGFDVCPPALPPQRVIPSSSAVLPLPTCQTQMQMSLASLNVSSLFVGPDGYGGKVQYLRQQMQNLRLNILGLQEARSPAGLSTVGNVIRMSSGCDKGHHGVELWIHADQPIGFTDGRGCFIDKKQVQALHSDPSRLLVRLVHPCLDCFFLVLHGPQSGRPLQERRTWWEETQCLVQQFCTGLPLYVLMDANAKTGPSLDSVFFAHGDTASANTEFLLEFLQVNHLCLPCTTDVHTGPTETWTAIDGLTQHRIDFIAVPQNDLSKCVFSTVLDALEPGNSFDDHCAVALQLHWSQTSTQTQSSGPVKSVYNRDAIRANRATLDLSDLVAPAWTTDIECQVQAFNQNVLNCLQQVCPSRRSAPKKPHITESAWELRTAKLHLRRRLQHARKGRSLDAVRLAFWAWRCSQQSSEPDDATTATVSQHAAHVSTVLSSLVHLNCRYFVVARALKRTLQRCKYQRLIDELAGTTDKTSAGDLLHLLKPFVGSSNPKKIKKRGLPAVKKADGSLCTTPAEATARWTEFFSAMEGGQVMSPESYRTLWWRNLKHFQETGPFSLPLTEVPTLVELEAAFRRVALGKAVGADNIPPELCHYKAVDLARLTYPMLLKIFLFGQEAIEHKGGRLAVAWKHRGDVRDCSTHRSLLVSSHIGKTLHRVLRQRHNGLYTAYMQTQQLGGRPKMPVGVPLHLSRAFLRWQKGLHRPTALVFLDLTEAFYRVVRPFALGGHLSDDDVAVIAARLGFDADTLHQFHAQLQQPSALQEIGASAFVERFLQALHSDTWFRVGSEGSLVRTTLGSRPGDSYADVVFGLLWAKLLNRYEQLLLQHGVLEMIPTCDLPHLFAAPSMSGPSIPFLGPTWMDDLNVCLAADTNCALERKTCFALSLLLDLCREHHMEPNLCKGKTEVMFSFSGPESRKFRNRYFAGSRSLPVVGEDRVYEVSVVSRYLHLGCILHHRDVDRVEVTKRLAVAHQAFTLHRKLLYHNSQIAWPKRKEIFVSLVLSKLLYGLESWTLQTQKVKEQFYNGVMRLYKRLLRVPHDSHLTDLELLTRSGLPLPDELLRGCRLRYYGSLHNCGSSAQWGLLHQDRPWINLIEDDVRWLWTQLCNSTDLADPELHYAKWKDLLVFHGGYWKKLVKKGIAHAISQRQNLHTVLQMHRGVGDVLLSHGFVPALPVLEQTLDPPSAFGCMLCGTRHLSHAGEKAHMFRCHQQVAPARFLFDETHCPACLKEFHTRTKVLAHLRHAHRCRQTLLGRNCRCDLMPGIGSVADEELRARHDGALPFQQAAGPCLPTARLRDFDDYSISLHEALYLCLLDLSDATLLRDTLQKELRRHAVCWTVCKRTLFHFLDEFTIDEAEPLLVSHEEVVQCIRALADENSWPFLTTTCTRMFHSLHGALPIWEHWCDVLACSPPAEWSSLQPQPRSLSRRKIILHAYSGRRRRGDVQWYIDELSATHPGVILQVVSVDIIIDSTYGDIEKESTRCFWLHHIVQGHVIGFLAGPPCNTWSRARNHALHDGKGPRVIRTPDEPWGKASLRLRELEQVRIGNLLLGFAFMCMAALAMRSGTGFLEHPREPDSPDQVSIWRLAILRLLLTLPRMRLVHVAQGLFGASSAKPTTLLVLGMVNLEKTLHSHRTTVELPWATSGLRDDLISMDCDESELPAEFVAQCTIMTNQFFGDFIGQD